MGRMSRRKGADGELEFARELSRVTGIEAHRGRQYQGSPESPDVRTSIPNVHIEVKRAETFSLYRALKQAISEAPEGAVPIVGHRRNNEEWVVVVRLEDLPKLAVTLFHAMAENA